jgi:hypothetical protein
VLPHIYSMSKTTDNKLQITGLTALSAALAMITVHVIEKMFGLHLNGTTPEVMGSITIVYHALLNWAGFNDLEKGSEQPKPPSSPE